MIFEHQRLRRSVALLASGALAGPEGEAARRHMDRCPRCRADHDEVTALLGRFDAETHAVRGAVPDLPLPVLVDLVNARITRNLTGPKAVWAWRGLAFPVAAVAVLLAWLVVPPAVRYFHPTAAPETASLAPETPLVSDAALARLERNVAREQAVRYLADAQDVLVNVAASPRDCEREAPSATLAPAPESRVNLVAESRRSRELLARRTLLVEANEAAVVSARPVLDDVEEMLREVASLEACTRPRDLARLREEMEKRQLLMKMRLMQRELAG